MSDNFDTYPENSISIQAQDPYFLLLISGYRYHKKGLIRKRGKDRFHAIVTKSKVIWLHFDVTIKKSFGRYRHSAFPLPNLLSEEKQRILSHVDK